MDLLQLQEVELSRLPQGFYTNIDNILDHELKTALISGQPISPTHVAPPVLVHQGDTVTIEAGSAGITVHTLGTALENGRLGQQISVRNNRSDKVLRSRVVARGRVHAGR